MKRVSRRYRDVGYPLQKVKRRRSRPVVSMRFSVYLAPSRDFKLSSTRCELFPSRVTSVFSINTAIMCPRVSLLLLCSFLLFVAHRCEENVTSATEENALAKLVKMFSKPGAFKRINAILGENSIEESSASCPKGEEGLECRRAEARRSVDCPQGDCYCYNCAAAGPELWASCCRESLRCCSHLAAACRTCDHPSLYPFCSKHFKKCLVEPNAKKQN